MSALPDRLGVIPLPHIVLFPDARLPLHVFEPRHCALVRDAVEGTRTMVVAVLQEGEEGVEAGSIDVHPVGCTGRIMDHQPRSDGSADLILRGEEVVDITGFVSVDPFHVASIRAREEKGCFATEAGHSERMDQLLQLFEKVCPGALESLRDRLFGDPNEDGGLELSHTIAMHLPVSLKRKLGWLERPGSLARWEKVRETLNALGSARELRARTLVQYSDLRPSKPGQN